MELFRKLTQSKLNVDFITKFLRGKGLAVKELDNDWWMVKAYDCNICYKYDNNRLSFTTILEAQLDDINLDILSKACNFINDNFYTIKNFWSYRYKDNAEDYEPIGITIHFSLEQICTSRDDIMSAYESYLSSLLDAIEKSKEAYRYFEYQLQKQVNNTIGFNYSDNPDCNSEEIQSKGRIGFK